MHQDLSYPVLIFYHAKMTICSGYKHTHTFYFTEYSTPITIFYIHLTSSPYFQTAWDSCLALFQGMPATWQLVSLPQTSTDQHQGPASVSHVPEMCSQRPQHLLFPCQCLVHFWVVWWTCKNTSTSVWPLLTNTTYGVRGTSEILLTHTHPEPNLYRNSSIAADPSPTWNSEGSVVFVSTV